jgi:hypothetical protein
MNPLRRVSLFNMGDFWVIRYDESVSHLVGKYDITINNSAARVVIAAAGKASLANDLRIDYSSFGLSGQIV